MVSEPQDTPAPQITPKRAILVLGMHRSGTSALTGLLEMFGATTPKQQIPASEQNARGFFEATRVARLNDKLLQLDDLTWDSWLPQPDPDDAQPVPRKLEQQAGDILKDEFGNATLIALKDPRICRLVPFWADALSAWEREPFFLLAMRNPMEVAQSLQARNEFELAHGLMLWMTYVLDSEASTRGRARAFSTFDLLMSEPTTIVAQLSDLLGLPNAHHSAEKQEEINAFLSPNLRHHASGDLSALPPIFAQIYELMTRWGQTGENHEDYAFLDRIRAEFQAIAAQPGEADELCEALSLIGQDTDSATLSAQVEGASKLLKPQLLAQFRILLRTNAALRTVQRRYQADPDQASQLRRSLLEQTNAVLAANQTAAKRAAELARLSHMLLTAQTENAQYEKITQRDLTRLQDLKREAASQRALRKRDQIALAEATRENTELHTLVAKLATEQTALNAMVAEVEVKRAALDRENAELHGLVQQLEITRHALVSSMSWRLSRPVRLAGRILQKIRRR